MLDFSRITKFFRWIIYGIPRTRGLKQRKSEASFQNRPTQQFSRKTCAFLSVIVIIKENAKVGNHDNDQGHC
ncbi:predicted protein [Enterococcus casseliflavus EC10]|nr:predicted protein [Enterococcus casseliflavus EC10]